MIKRSFSARDKNIRILKVLDNQDYLASDSDFNYYILSVIESRNQTTTTLLKSRLNTYETTQNNIIAPNEIITIDSINYYILDIGSQEAVCIANVEISKMNNSQFQIKLFEESLRYVLKTLLLWRLK